MPISADCSWERGVKDAKKYFEGSPLRAIDIVSEARTIELKKGPNAIRVVFSFKANIKYVDDIKLYVNNETDISKGMVQANYDSGEGDEPQFETKGFVYRVFEHPEKDFRAFLKLYRSLSPSKNLQEGFMNEEFSGIIDSYSIMPQVVKAISSFQVLANDVYNVDAESEHMMSLQIGSGLETKKTDQQIDKS